MKKLFLLLFVVGMMSACASDNAARGVSRAERAISIEREVDSMIINQSFRFAPNTMTARLGRPRNVPRRYHLSVLNGWLFSNLPYVPINTNRYDFTEANKVNGTWNVTIVVNNIHEFTTLRFIIDAATSATTVRVTYSHRHNVYQFNGFLISN